MNISQPMKERNPVEKQSQRSWERREMEEWNVSVRRLDEKEGNIYRETEAVKEGHISLLQVESWSLHWFHAVLDLYLVLGPGREVARKRGLNDDDKKALSWRVWIGFQMLDCSKWNMYSPFPNLKRALIGRPRDSSVFPLRLELFPWLAQVTWLNCQKFVARVPWTLYSNVGCSMCK